MSSFFFFFLSFLLSLPQVPEDTGSSPVALDRPRGSGLSDCLDPLGSETGGGPVKTPTKISGGPQRGVKCKD